MALGGGKRCEAFGGVRGGWGYVVRGLGCLVVLGAVAFGGMGSKALVPAQAGRTVLGIDGSRFTINGEDVFLLGFSYYGGLGASQESVRRDLDDFQKRGFNWLRLWATWKTFGEDVSAVNAKGAARPVYMERLQWIVAECDRRGMVVDVTLNRREGSTEGGGLADAASHRRAVEAIVEALRPYRNWYLDLANERDVGDARFVSCEELKRLRQAVRRLDPKRLVTASFGGHDLSRGDLRDVLVTVGVDFVSVHRPRRAGSPEQTEQRTREILAMMKAMGRVRPVHHQEPFRRGYGSWVPKAEDFLTDLKGAVDGGAAGWCFHNGSQRNGPGQQPRRSFDMRRQRLFEQLDEQELKFVNTAKTALKDNG